MIPTSVSDDQSVRDAFAQWASLQAGAPRDSAKLIEHVDVSHDHLGLFDTEVHGRRFVWKSVPVSARSRATTPAVAIETLEPWSIEAVPLREQTIHIAACTTCAGEKKVRCHTCGGTGKTICPACNGQRKMYGYSANGAYRLLNCTTCHGKGQLDCIACRRGIAVCAECAGEGRVQRWVEIETWNRSVSTVHPRTIGLQFAWRENPATEVITRDAEFLADVERPYPLTSSDLGDVPAQWLDILKSELMPGERVARQLLRVARVPTYSVDYRLGADEDRISFVGLRLVGPQSGAGSVFARRAVRLRSLRWLLIAVGIVITLVSLSRGVFFWSVSTFLSLFASGGALVAIYVAAADWTAARLQTRRWLIVAASCLVGAIVFALASLPRVGHAERLIVVAHLEDADAELHALGDEAAPSTWADLRLAQIREATNIEAARGTLAKIPRELPQYVTATNAVDALILQTARNHARMRRWSSASDALALLSQNARGRPEIVAIATTVHVPLARQRIEAADWPGAASVIVAARRFGVAPLALEPLTAAIRTAGIDRAAEAKRESDAGKRLRLRLAAEETLVSWERSTETWGTPFLIALRTSMAHDIALLEHRERRRRAS